MGAGQTLAGLLAVIAPVIGVPLTVIVFYLKGMREHQVRRLAELDHRVDAIDASLRRLADDMADVVRDFATKEEWLREAMWARDRIERMGLTVARMEPDQDGLEVLMSTTQRTGHMVDRIFRTMVADETPGRSPSPMETHGPATANDGGVDA